jgi:hypothetical protein
LKVASATMFLTTFLIAGGITRVAVLGRHGDPDTWLQHLTGLKFSAIRPSCE